MLRPMGIVATNFYKIECILQAVQFFGQSWQRRHVELSTNLNGPSTCDHCVHRFTFCTIKNISNLSKTSYIVIYYMTVDDNTWYPTAIKIVLARLWDNTFFFENVLKRPEKLFLFLFIFKIFTLIFVFT